jgi:hypothetical protein
MDDTIYRAFARERIAVDGTVKVLTATLYNPLPEQTSKQATLARITVEAQPLRYTEEGTDPVAATTGTLAAASDVIYLKGLSAIQKAKFIRDGGTSSAIEVVYFR